ncbi:hypothetical protein [Arthrobacter sp. NtRootA1]|uniref:hypothetical protein n=1 Tax=Arthrobacter sp. NtRootA1 TaxID=2830983 RepID=UPI001CC64058|nr:hypothetical protein [Arthrobacter sp. NtRootA1]BCW04953.1 hypothetical protein NtRootA1_10910 [Arthrobacter sp. NtRootA1]
MEGGALPRRSLVPGAIVTEQQTKMDGRSGTAVGTTEDGVRTDVIFDPAPWLFIGMRAVNVKGTSDFPPVPQQLGLPSEPQS